MPKLISDGMILQRDIKIKLWGRASPNEKVTVNFNGKQYQTTAGKDSKWLLQLPPQQAGGPYDITFNGNNSVTIKNVLFGDVWVCSGQSNMELTMERVKDKYPDVIENANNTNIRQFEVPDQYNFNHPNEDVAYGQWLPATKENILKFSAVAYFFARDIYNKYKVPVGIVNTALGGSPAEAWISEEGLKKFPAYYNEAQKFKDSSLIHKIEAHDRSVSSNWYNTLHQKDEGIKNNWQSPDMNDADWQTMNIPGYWADGPLGNVNGVVWFRKAEEVPAAFIGEPVRLIVGRIVDADSVFVNGQFAGTTSYQYPPRRYVIPAGVLKEGRNEIVVRVISNADKGGFVPDKTYALIAGKDTLDIDGTWKYKLGATMNALPSQTFIRWKPEGLYNAMIAPLTKYTIKGILWYQGESNAGHPADYEALMKTLIADWRTHWNKANIPFIYVQLPNFMEAKRTPAESNWAALRQAQLNTLAVPGTGMAVAIDLGEWNDIHPLDKQDAGKRLALQAAHLAYGEKHIVYSGPVLQSAKTEGNKLILSFTNMGSGLMAKGSDSLHYFSIAGKDKHFVWAKAIIQGDKVVVWNDLVTNPVYVRYAWADNPEGANLYNKEGLPASPFEASVK
ncbi:sialate O-acetylesterase [Ilyomonas limi]|uniref:sialate O-acetylesterase n=1 Tax=Ilyomonas limi TaxID=2575867 RepID=UPI001F0E1113|nr:sialate O-acetylesterase [Ilyomonas limi]